MKLSAFSKKKLGQNFLICEDVAKLAAAYGRGRNVLELGGGTGILTKQLCLQANTVLSVEIDQDLCEELKKINQPNLRIVCDDFFSIKESKLTGFDILIANIPYNLSSKTLFWLSSHSMEGVLCVQKEFAEHMLAKPGTRSYSKLSVFSQLSFSIETILNVPAACFRPKPKVDSILLHIRNTGNITSETWSYVRLLMEHKKKTVTNAVMDSHNQLGMTKAEARSIASKLDCKERVFKLKPNEILDLSERIQNMCVIKKEKNLASEPHA